jgi:hypothetical protein
VIVIVIEIVVMVVVMIVIVIAVEHLWLFDPRTSLLCRQRGFIGAYGIFNKHVKYEDGYI